jgi:hypothetical protein
MTTCSVYITETSKNKLFDNGKMSEHDATKEQLFFQDAD